jgi:hypothetical protein
VDHLDELRAEETQLPHGLLPTGREILPPSDQVSVDPGSLQKVMSVASVAMALAVSGDEWVDPPWPITEP